MFLPGVDCRYTPLAAGVIMFLPDVDGRYTPLGGGVIMFLPDVDCRYISPLGTVSSCFFLM